MKYTFLAALMVVVVVADLFFICWGLQFWGPGENVWWGFPLTVCLLVLGAGAFASLFYFLNKREAS